MGTLTPIAASAMASRWDQTNDTPTRHGLLLPVMVLLGIVIAIELMSLVLVIQGHVTQAEIRERIRAATPVTTRVATRL